ncbi:hypothetical protein HHI36_002678 [Cryptolaemus montrouzieri]|uniref:Uncharacterized protein n=1 Tax=Cryptolaemus montrouzieri TaxID=559131 RepID=A0ABD2PB60_9CUCU
MIEEQRDMKKKVDTLETDQNEIENNIIIDGLINVRDVQNEYQMKKVVIDMGKKISVNNTEADFACETMPKSHKVPRVKFKSIEKKDALMQAKKELTIKAQDIGLQGNSIVYINRDLTNETQSLFRKDAEFSDCGSKIFCCNDNDNDDDLFRDSIPFTAEAFAELKTKVIFLNKIIKEKDVIIADKAQIIRDKKVIIDLLNSKLTDLKSSSKIDCDKEEDISVINNRKNKNKRSTIAEDTSETSSPTPSASTQRRAQATIQGENYAKVAGNSTFSNSNDKGSPVLPINTTEPTNRGTDGKISTNNLMMTQSIDNSTNDEWIEKTKIGGP